MSDLILQRTGILAYLDDEARELLTSYGEIATTSPLEVFIREGDINTRLYIVLSGQFNVFTSVKGKEILLDTVGPGDCLGEVALFNPDRASASVKSLQAGRLWAIDSSRLEEFLNEFPAWGCAVILGVDIILSRRLKHANEVIRSNEIVPGFLNVRAQQRFATGQLPQKVKGQK
jgi:CRP/FNR family cyclic AMP-dependent transcriptional regulator